jgi:AraC-like DNA-binding protein
MQYLTNLLYYLNMQEDLIFLASSYAPRAQSRINKYLQGYATIQYMQRGAVELAYDDDVQVLRGAWSWPAYPGPHLRFNAPVEGGHWFHRHLAFQGPLFEEWISLGYWPMRSCAAPPSRTPAEWGKYMDSMIELSRRGDSWGRRRAINMLEGLLLELCETSVDRQSAESPWLQKVLSLLQLNQSSLCDYAQLARQLGLSEGSLRRKFKAATGTSLHAYVLQQRMVQARTMLAETDLPIKTIALRLGYSNVYFFSRQFKQMTGAPPAAYRQSRALRGA